MPLIDTHAHLYLPEFSNDIHDVVARASRNSVEKILLPNIDRHSVDDLMNLCKAFPDICIPMTGLHPTSVNEHYPEDIEFFEHELAQNNYIAVGEIGIDLYWDKTYYKEQLDAFKMQLNIALKNNLPVVIHARNSFDEILNVLDQYKQTGLTGVLHSFTGTFHQAEHALNLGFCLGVGGISTFKNAGVGEVIAAQPLERLILETDSPYLAPVPYRGKRNESAYVKHIATHLAKLKNVTVAEIENITTANAQKLFNL